MSESISDFQLGRMDAEKDINKGKVENVEVALHNTDVPVSEYDWGYFSKLTDKVRKRLEEE